MNREALITKLNDFYKGNGITPDDKFNCKNKEKCGIVVANTPPSEISSGMQCHVGHNYGSNCPKVLVICLDCGNGGIQTIEDRTTKIENVPNEAINPHMRGTIKVLTNFLNMGIAESLTHYAMTNSCKCCRSNSPDQIEPIFYINCCEYKFKEIEILNPDIIYFQGKNALLGLENKVSDVENIPAFLFPFIKYVEIFGVKYLSVFCIHPSARGTSGNKMRIFYEDTIIQINDYIKNNLMNN